MKKAKNAKKDFFDLAFLKDLRTGPYLQFCVDLSELSLKASYEADSTKLLTYVEAVKTAQGVSRVNPYVERQNEIVSMIKAQVSVLRNELKNASDDSEAAAYAIYKNTLKGKTNRGKHEYIMAVGTFLNGLCDIEFDGDVATRISTIRILQSRYQSEQESKTSELIEIKARTSGTKIRREIHNFVVLVCAKLLVKDSTGESSYAEELKTILANYKSIFVRHESDEKDECDTPITDGSKD